MAADQGLSLNVEVALGGTKSAEIRELLHECGVGVAMVERAAIVDGPGDLAAPPLFVEITEDELGAPHDLLDAVAKRSDSGPIITIVDAALVDLLAPLLDVPDADILVWPVEREAAMRVLKRLEPGALVSELEAPDDFDLGRLRDELGRITDQLSRLVGPDQADAAFQSSRSSAENAALLRKLIQQRRVRASFFPSDLFADPAWDILLDLAAARHEGKPVSISSLCIAASVPTTTGLRWIKGMTEAALLQRQPDPRDARRSFITLTETTAAQMDAYLEAVS